MRKRTILFLSAFFLLFSGQHVHATVIYDFVKNGNGFSTKQENVLASIGVSDSAVNNGKATISDVKFIYIAFIARLNDGRGIPILLTKQDVSPAAKNHTLEISADRLRIKSFSQSLPSAPDLNDAWLMVQSFQTDSGLTDVDHVAHLRSNTIYLESSITQYAANNPLLYVTSDVAGVWKRRSFSFPIIKKIDIQINPGIYRKCINTFGRGFISVVLYSESAMESITRKSFDATNVDPKTLELEGLSVHQYPGGRFLSSMEDIDRDGADDLIVLFKNLEGAFESSDEHAVLTGQTYDGTRFQGRDRICLVPPQRSLNDLQGRGVR